MNYYKLLMISLILGIVGTSTSQELSYKSGYATRYWDCCKPHCAWKANTSRNPVKTCNADNESNEDNFDIKSSCDGGDGYTCYNMVPWKVTSELSYGFAAVPATDDICGKCYELKFTGTSHNGNEPGSIKLLNKRMIVQAINIGYDVEGGQFDILIPGGGVGNFNACSSQWKVSDSDLGEQYGGFLANCKIKLGYNANLEDYKNCVEQSCEKIFNEPGMSKLNDGCKWFVEWYEAADNPNIEYKQVPCPQEIVNVSGIGKGLKTIVLTSASMNAVVATDTVVLLYGTSGVNNIIVESGAEAKMVNFPGNNNITIQAVSSLFSVFRSGATVTFKDSNGTVLTIPATKTAQTIIFNDLTRTFVIDNNQVKLGNQVINLTSSPIL